MREEWKILIKGTVNTYEASSFGRFRRLGKHKNNYLKPYLRNCIENKPKQNNRKHTLIIKCSPDGANNKSIEYNCKKAIAELFIRKLNPNEVVITKNNNTFDIRVNNLFITTKRNLGQITGYQSGKSKRVAYYDSTGYKFTYRSARECAKQLNTNYQTILDICNKKNKRKPAFNVEFENLVKENQK